MPNIELHGYGKMPIETVKKIQGVLKDSPDAAEIVITIHPTIMINLDDKSSASAFLRVISSPDGLDDLLDRLKPLGEDIELIMLEQWIPST